MLNLSKVRKQYRIQNVSCRKPLSDIIGESYELMYECKKPNLRKLIEAHIEDINQNPTMLTALNNNLFALKSLVENEGLDDTRIDVEDAQYVDLDPKVKEITDIKAEEPEEAETESREEKTDKAIESSDSPITEQFKKFSENSRSKLFVKNLGKCLGKMNEGKNAFNLQESIDLYKASNSMMTQMAIELEHNEAFKSTFNSCTRVLGEAVKNVLDSIREGKAIDEHSMTVLKKFSSALREDSDEEIENFIDWVDDEDTTDGEVEVSVDAAEEEVEGCPHEAAEELLSDVAPEDVPTAVEDIVDATVDDEEVEDVSIDEEELSDEEVEDLKKYLALIRGVEEDSEEMEEAPTEEEIDAMESRVRYKRDRKKESCRRCESNLKRGKKMVDSANRKAKKVNKSNRNKLKEEYDPYEAQSEFTYDSDFEKLGLVFRDDPSGVEGNSWDYEKSEGEPIYGVYLDCEDPDDGPYYVIMDYDEYDPFYRTKSKEQVLDKMKSLMKTK